MSCAAARITFCVALSLLGLTSAVKARADDNGPWFEAGVRAGASVPFGSAPFANGGGSESGPAQPTSLGAMYSTEFASQIDLGLRVSRYWYMGVYAQYGRGSATTDLCANACPQTNTGNGYAAGLDVQVYPWPQWTVVPWIGMGLGVEDIIGGGGDGAAWQYRVETGVDWRMGPIGVGPFAMLSLGQYAEGQNHGWISIGARATWDAGR